MCVRGCDIISQHSLSYDEGKLCKREQLFNMHSLVFDCLITEIRMFLHSLRSSVTV